MTKWVIVRAEYGTEGKLLKEGWEPFAVAPETSISNMTGMADTKTFIYLRKKVLV